MSVAKLNVAVNNMACVMNLTVLLPYLFRIVWGPLPIEVIVIIIIIIIITRPKPPSGRQGLAGLWGKDTVRQAHYKVFSTSHFAPTQLGSQLRYISQTKCQYLF